MAFKYKAILLDLDGTLIDSLGDICGHMNRVRAHYGLAPRSPSELRPFIGHGVDYLAGNAIPELGKNKEAEIIALFREQYARSPHVDGRLYPGVAPTLAAMKSGGARLAIATNKASLVAERCLEHYLPDFPFEVVAGPDRVTQRKPDPAHLSEVLDQMGLSSDEACFVGDHAVDREVAQAAGVDFFGAAYGFGGVEVSDDQRLDNFPDLLEKIQPPS